MKTFKKISSGVVDLNEPIVIDICMTCDLYRTLTATLSQLKLEIVASKVFIIQFVYTSSTFVVLDGEITIIFKFI